MPESGPTTASVSELLPLADFSGRAVPYYYPGAGRALRAGIVWKR